MADTGKIVTKGLHASAIKYVVLKGLVPNPGGTSLNAMYVTRGLGNATARKLALHGLSTNPGGGGGGTGAFWVFGDSVIL